MVMLTTLVLCAFSVGGLSILQFTFHTYNKEIYQQSAQALQVSSNSVEAELKKMERLSYQVATDNYLQSYLLALREADSNYDRFVTGTELRRRLLNIGALNKYVLSIQVYDLLDNEYASGNHIRTLPEDRLKLLQETANEHSGGVDWVIPSEDDDSLTAARNVRSYLDFSLEKIGTVTLRVDVDSIITELTNHLSETETTFAVINEEDEFVFYNNEEEELNFLESMERNTNGYDIVEEDGRRYFLTYSSGNQMGWTYMIATPYNNLFSAISTARTAVLIIFSALFILLIFLGTKFTGTITNPIESLNKKMKRVQTGDLEGFDRDDDATYYRDEAGQLHDNFRKMMEQIDNLISENYKKQIVIKDSEFKTLQAQVNPHFLYNTLESINWSAKIVGHKQISQMAESLGYVLRASINMKDSLIQLEEELMIVEHYVTIQSYRFEERLDFVTDIEDSTLSYNIPKFVIQPLVENAIRYGLQQMLGTCKIILRVKEIDDLLYIIVEDDGPGMEEQFLKQLKTGDYQPKGTGIGLRNIDERIKILFGEDYGIKVESKLNEGTKVIIKLPIEGRNKNVQSVVGR